MRLAVVLIRDDIGNGDFLWDPNSRFVCVKIRANGVFIISVPLPRISNVLKGSSNTSLRNRSL
jgi:hypothetical protein